MLIVIFVKGVIPIDVSSFANCVSNSLRSASRLFWFVYGRVDQKYLVSLVQPSSSVMLHC